MITITITKTLDDSWASDKEFAEMSDEDIINLCLEDSSELLNNSSWEVIRDEKTE